VRRAPTVLTVATSACLGAAGAIVLAKQNRVLTAADFKAAVRSGRRSYAQHAVVYTAARDSVSPTRFGFIVGKNVGGAVQRNLVRRRLRAIGAELLSDQPTGRDIVVRALPGAHQVGWDTLHSEITDVVNGSGRR
jgi:ribonuclease P protein component